MTIYAVIKTGGKEYRVAPGDVVRVDRLAAAPGATVEIQGVTAGAPDVAAARVTAEVIEESHGEKILIFKKKRRDHYQMMTGEEHGYTTLRIRDIAVAAAPTLPLQPQMPHAAPPPSPVQLVPPVAAHGDAPAPPKVANEEPVPTVESAQAVPKRRHGIAALVAGLAVIAAGLLILGSREPRAPGKAAVELANVAPPPEAAQPSVPPPAAKAPPRKEVAVRKTAAASAPAAPVQPPE